MEDCNRVEREVGRGGVNCIEVGGVMWNVVY